MLSSAAVPLITGLAAYWKLEEASGTRVDSVTGIVLTDGNTVTSNPGIQGTAAQFTTVNSEYLTVLDTTTLRMGTSFTIAFWCYPDTASQGNWMVAKFTTSQGYAVYLTTGQLRCTIGSAGGNTDAVSTLVPATAAWSFVVAWVDATAGLIWLQLNNGTPQSTALVSAQTEGTAAFFIGARSSTQSFFNGRLDEVGMWKRMLTAADRTTLYNAGAGRTYPFAGF